MKLILLLNFTFFISINLLLAQNETDERVLGYKHFLKFNQSNPVLTIETGNFFDPNVWHANNEKITHYANSICDTLGHLLFYYDGLNIYNKDKTIFTNGNVHTQNFSTFYNSSLIVPIEESNRRFYYLFETIPYEENWSNSKNACGTNTPCPEFLELCKLQYHIIDIATKNVISKNNIIMDSVSSSVSGVKHLNNIDTWISVIKFKSNKIYNFKINSCSISNPVINTIPDFEYEINPQNYSPLFDFKYNFQIVYSTIGDYVAFNGYKVSDPLPTGNNIRYSYLFYTKFDNNTGVIDIGNIKTTGPPTIYENSYTTGPPLFSHDSKKIYYFSIQKESHLTQFEINTNTSTSLPMWGGSFQVSPFDYGKNDDLIKYNIVPDNKYGSFIVSPPFHFNDYPYFIYSQYVSSLGINDFNPIYTSINNKTPYYSTFDPIVRNNYIYNFYNPNYKKPSIIKIKNSNPDTINKYSCFNVPIYLNGNVKMPIDSMYWEILNSNQKYKQRFNSESTSLILNPGTYTAKFITYKNCIVDSSSQQFTVEDFLPNISFENDTLYTCDTKEINLPTYHYANYTWVNINKELVSSPVTKLGQYTLIAQNSCGTIKDSIYVNKSNLNVVNLITPNADNKNDCFYVETNNSNESITINIYNTWGSRIFSDYNYKTNWCPENTINDGIYNYEINYNNNCIKRGWVEIIR